MAGLIRLSRSTVIAAPIATVWRRLRDFNSHAGWHPSVAGSDIENGEPADLIGAVRAFTLADGSFLREQLIALSDTDHVLVYCLLEAPLPLHSYVATMRLLRVTDADRTFLQWESRFLPPAAQAEMLVGMVLELYEAGMAALRACFE